MVLFIYHHADLVLNKERGAGTRPRFALETSQFLADEMAFMQQLPFRPIHLVEPKRHGGRQAIGRAGRLAHAIQHRRSVAVLGPLAEGNAVHVPGEPNARRQNDRGLRSRSVEPAHATIGQEGKIHYSSTRMRSRSSAASSKFSPSTARRSCALSSNRWLRGSASDPTAPGIS